MTGLATEAPILAVRVGRGGDLVMLTPALQALLDAYPTREVHLLTSAEGRRTLRGFHERLITAHIYDWRWPARWLGAATMRRALRAAGYARAYVFETHERYRRLAASAASETLVLPSNNLAAAGSHYSARCFVLVSGSLAKAPRRSWVRLPVTDEGRAAAVAHLERHGIGPDERVVGLHLTYSGSLHGIFAGSFGARHRVWPQASAAETARRIRAAHPGVRVVVDLLPDEEKHAEAFTADAGDAVTVLRGAPDFERYKALLERFHVLVSPNTGPMHMAAAVGTNVVALFSGWSPEDCGPFVPADRQVVLRAEETAQPDKGLAALDPGAIAAAAGRFLRP